MKQLLRLAVCMAFAGIVAAGAPSVVTRAKYERIEEGMTYEQVYAMIGGAGEEIASTDIAGYTTVTFSWKNPDGSYMNAMFQDGLLMSKAQSGLPKGEADFSRATGQAASLKQEAPTTVEPYHFGEQLGETLDTFLSRRNDSVADTCFREAHPDKKTARKNKRSPPHLCADYTSGNVTIREQGPHPNYVFVDGKLAQIVMVDLHPDREQQWRWLIEKYSAPTERHVKTYQNGFGAQWECVSAVWKLPNGEAVLAAESMQEWLNNAVWLTVSFLSREAMLKAEKDPGKPNPY